MGCACAPCRRRHDAHGPQHAHDAHDGRRRRRRRRARQVGGWGEGGVLLGARGGRQAGVCALSLVRAARSPAPAWLAVLVCAGAGAAGPGTAGAAAVAAAARRSTTTLMHPETIAWSWTTRTSDQGRRRRTQAHARSLVRSDCTYIPLCKPRGCRWPVEQAGGGGVRSGTRKWGGKRSMRDTMVCVCMGSDRSAAADHQRKSIINLQLSVGASIACRPAIVRPASLPPSGACASLRGGCRAFI